MKTSSVVVKSEQEPQEGVATAEAKEIKIVVALDGPEPTEAARIGEAVTTKVRGGPREAPDTPPRPPKVVVIVITSMGTRLGTVWPP